MLKQAALKSMQNRIQQKQNGELLESKVAEGVRYFQGC